MRYTSTGTERKSPKTIEKCSEEIVQRLKWSRENIARLKRTGEYEKYGNRTLNPNGVGEMTLGSTATARDFKAARELEAAGVIVVVRGSLDGKTIRPGEFWPDAYILEGPNFPKD
jgi:hypothetical protein